MQQIACADRFAHVLTRVIARVKRKGLIYIYILYSNPARVNSFSVNVISVRKSEIELKHYSINARVSSDSIAQLVERRAGVPEGASSNPARVRVLARICNLGVQSVNLV